MPADAGIVSVSDVDYGEQQFAEQSQSVDFEIGERVVGSITSNTAGNVVERTAEWQPN